VDDPAVADELSLPAIAILRNADNARQVDLSFEYSKRITDTRSSAKVTSRVSEMANARRLVRASTRPSRINGWLLIIYSNA
jgi:hypothetical protein